MSYKERLKNLAKKSLANQAPGAKGSALSLAVGFAAYHLEQWVFSQTWNPKSPFVVPLAMAVLGHILKGRYPAIGVALLGAAGHSLARGLQIYNASKPKPGPDAQGFYGGREAALLQEARGYADGDAALVQEAMAG